MKNNFDFKYIVANGKAIITGYNGSDEAIAVYENGVLTII